MRATVLLPHGRVHFSSGIFLPSEIAKIFKWPVMCAKAVPTWSRSSFKRPVLRAAVLFPHGRVLRGSEEPVITRASGTQVGVKGVFEGPVKSL